MKCWLPPPLLTALQEATKRRQASGGRSVMWAVLPQGLEHNRHPSSKADTVCVHGNASLAGEKGEHYQTAASPNGTNKYPSVVYSFVWQGSNWFAPQILLPKSALEKGKRFRHLLYFSAISLFDSTWYKTSEEIVHSTSLQKKRKKERNNYTKSFMHT